MSHFTHADELSGKAPPQFVFEMMVAQATRRFLSGLSSADDVADDMAASFADLYDFDQLATDILKGIERILIFIDSVRIDDPDLLLTNFIWFVANYENVMFKRKKKPLIGSPLKGRPRNPGRVYSAALSFRAFAYVVRSHHAPAKPQDWTPASEEEFRSVFVRLFPEIRDEATKDD